jgi:hypothetical protein
MRTLQHGLHYRAGFEMIVDTNFGPQVVANTAKALVLANWSSVCDATWLAAMGAPNLPTPAAANIFTSQRALFTAEKQPAIGLSVLRTDSTITDALGAMTQIHELEIAVCSDWGYYDGTGANPLVFATAPDAPIPFTAEVYETALRAFVEGIVLILCSPTYGFINYDARNQTTAGFVSTGIYNALPFTGVTPTNFVVGEDEIGQSVIQQTVRASVQVQQRRSIAR